MEEDKKSLALDKREDTLYTHSVFILLHFIKYNKNSFLQSQVLDLKKTVVVQSTHTGTMAKHVPAPLTA